MFDNDRKAVKIMNDTTTIGAHIKDLSKNLTKEWQQYQANKLKLKMEELGVLCRCRSVHGEMDDARLMIMNAEQRISVSDGAFHLIINIRNIQGYNLIDHSIEIILNIPPHAVLISFPSQEIYELAVVKFQRFLWETPLLPTPPDSSLNGSD